MNIEPPRSRLFVLEDDRDLLDEIIEVARASDYDIVSARSLEEAIEEFEKEVAQKRPIHLVLVDTMIPETKSDWKLLDELRASRVDYILGRSRTRQIGDFSDEELNQSREYLTDLDRKIQLLVKLDGGATFLEHALERGFLDHSHVGTFSARAKIQNPFFERMKSKLGLRWIGWMQKPMNPELLIDLLNKHRS
jgi:CheY-like chemotaxis protein